MRKPSITTKTGDKGQTTLFSGEKVSKHSPRLETYGDIDELVSLLSVARHHVQNKNVQDEILFIQRSLFIVSSELATTADKLKKLPKRVDEEMLDALEKKRIALEEQVELPRGFVIPGNTLGSAYLDYGRAVIRRCERKVVALLEGKIVENEILLVWLNRLSDYLYLLARLEEGTPLLVNPSTPRPKGWGLLRIDSEGRSPE